MSLRTVLVSDVFAYAFLERRPYPSWEPFWKGYRDRAIITPEYGLLYIAAMLKDQGIPFDLVNMVADHWTDMRWFEVSDNHQHDAAARAEFDALLQRMKDDTMARIADADVVMIPLSYYYMVRGVKRLITQMREAAPNATFIVGGNYASMHAFELIFDGHADVVVRGEGEDTIVQLMAELESGAHRTGKLQTLGISYQVGGGEPGHNMDMPRINDLDRLPHMYFAGDEFRVGMRHLFLKTLQPEGDYFIGSSYVTSRGCPEKCTFCMDPTIWNRKVRFHSPDYVQRVVQYCWDNYHKVGNPKFYFGDATYTLRKPRLYEMCEKITGIGWNYNVQTRADMVDRETLERMKAAGFSNLAFGSESFNDEILENVVLKRQTSQQVLDGALLARELGLDPILTFIAGLPGESKESHLRTVQILRENGFTEATFFPLVVFRGTPLYDQFVANKSPEEVEKARFDEDSEEYCCLSEDFPTKEALIAWAGYLNSEIRKGAPDTTDDMSGSDVGHLLAG
ncbi:MAG TPA: radical SAM protein [Actinomycetota bacterium]|nr:radical SAM protein [Actinomycetota bacterium]